MVSHAADELKFLLNQGYRKDYALNFVGDHHQLQKKDRNRLMREIHSDRWCEHVKKKLYPANAVNGHPITIDGFNVLITLDAGLNGGDVFKCHDGIIRDNTMAFANYRISEKTTQAADKVINLLNENKPKHVTWILDSQISGSGRLAEYIRRKMSEVGLSGESMTSPNTDYKVEKMNLVTATSDSALIQRLNYIVDIPSALIDL